MKGKRLATKENLHGASGAKEADDGKHDRFKSGEAPGATQDQSLEHLPSAKPGFDLVRNVQDLIQQAASHHI